MRVPILALTLRPLAVALAALVGAGCMATPSAPNSPATDTGWPNASPTEASAEMPTSSTRPTPTAVPTSSNATALPSAAPVESEFPIALPAAMERRYQAALPLFAYDDGGALELASLDTQEVDELRIERISYAGPSDVVPGIVVSPVPRDGLPALIMVFPGPGADLLDRAQDFARLGMMVLLIDPPQVRRDGDITRFTAADRDEQIQLMLELRRGVDVLTELGADPTRIAYWGYSWGCAMGAQLAGIEHRIGSFVLMYCDGGVVEHFTGPNGPEDALAGLTVDQRAAWLSSMEPIEPLYFIGHASPSALLLQSALHDEVIPRANAERLHRYASQPKQIRWYDSGHEDAPPEVWCDQARWLHSRLDLVSFEVPECS